MSEVHTEINLVGKEIAEHTSKIQSAANEIQSAANGRELLTRTFAVQAAAGDGRTIHVRVVPFNEVADVADPPDFKPYKEQFMPGAFARNEPHAHRIRLRSDHAALDSDGSRKSGTSGIVGNGVTLTQTDGGYEGEFKFLDTPDALTARELVLNGGYDGVSAEFLPIKSTRVGGVVQRQVAHLDSVALATGPAYPNAAILSLREEQIIDEDMLPPPNKELLERCARLGIAIPAGMETMLARAFTEQPWDGDESRWETSADYAAACAIDLNKPDKTKARMLCHLPYKEPGSGMVNVNGVRAALASLERGAPRGVPQPQRDAAQAMLEGLLASFNSPGSTT